MKKLLFLFSLFSGFLYSQNVTIPTDGLPPTVVACGDAATFKFRVYGPLPSGSTVSLTLPSGSRFSGLVSGNVTATPTAAGANFVTNAALATAADFIEVVYTVSTDCATSSFGDLSYKVGSVTKTSPYPTVERSLLEITSVTPTSATVPAGGSQPYAITVKQSAATYSNNVVISVRHSTNVQISTTLGNITAGTPAAGVQTDRIELTGAQISAIGDGDTRFEQGETITVNISAKLLACSTGEQLRFQAGYGCNPFNACLTGNPTDAGLSSPAAVATTLSIISAPKLARPGLTPSEPDTAIYVLKNTGSAPAYNVNVRMGISAGYADFNPYKQPSLDFSNFSVNGISMDEEAGTDTALFNFSTDPDGAGGLADLDGDGLFDDLPAGEQVQFQTTVTRTAEAANRHSQDCQKFYQTYSFGTVRWGLSYTNACQVRSSYNEPNTNLTNQPITISFPNTSSDVTGTRNYAAGNQFSIIYTPDQTYTSLTKTNIGMADGFWRIRLQLPAGLVPGTNPTSTNAGWTIVLNNTLTDAATNTYYYDVRPISSNNNLDDFGRFNLPILVSSSCNTNGSFSAEVSMQLMRNASTPIINKLGCSTTPTFTLGCATPIGLGIQGFDMKRTTFGYADAAGTTLATAATTGINTNAYLNGDHAQADYSLVFNANNLQTANVFLEYAKNDWLKVGYQNSNVLGISGTYNGTSFSISQAQASSYYTYTDSFTAADGTEKSGYNFDIQKLFSSTGPLAGQSITAGQTLVFKVDFRVAEFIASAASGINLNGFLSYSSSTLPNTSTAVIGNYITDKVQLFSYSDNPIAVTGQQSANFSYCEPGNISAGITFSNTSFIGDLFPNEFRYNHLINSVTFLAPAGFTYIPGSSRYEPIGLGTQTIGDPTIQYGFNIDGTPNPNGLFNKYTYTNDGSWKRADATTTYDIPGIYFNVKLNSKFAQYRADYPATIAFRIVGGDINYSLNFDTPEKMSYPSGVAGYRYSITDFSYSVSSGSQSVATNANSAQWPVTISNTTSGGQALPKAWIALVSPNNNITPTLWDGATQIPLTSYGTGKYWAQLGDIATVRNLTVRTDSFTVCGTDNLEVITGYDCTEYPVNPDQGYTSQGNTVPGTKSYNLSLTTQSAQLSATAAVLPQTGGGADSNPSTYTICEPINQQLTVTNGAVGNAFAVTPYITLPVGMSFVPDTFKVTYKGTTYNLTSSDVTLVSGATYKVNIYNSSIPFVTNNTGLPGVSAPAGDNTFVLNYSVTPLCTASGGQNYVGGSRISYTVTGKSGCQSDLAPVNANSGAINIEGAPSNKAYATTFSSLESDPTKANFHVNDAEKLLVRVDNQSGGNTGQLESIKVSMDAAYDYVPGSMQITANNTFAGMTATDPTVTTLASGEKVLEWALPSGFAPGQTIEFTYSIKAANPAALQCVDTKNMYLNTYIGGSATCSANGQTCNLIFPTGTEAIVQAIAHKPAITAAIQTTTFTAVNGNTNYTFGYSVKNNDTAFEVKPNIKMVLYNDVNNNGVLDAGDVAVDSQLLNITVAPGQTVNSTVSGTYAGNIVRLIASFESNTNVSDICSAQRVAVQAICYVAPNTAAGISASHGFTLLQRAGAGNGNWPMSRTSAHTVLESNTKGLVITRVSTAGLASITNPVEGMMVYDTTAKCLKIYVVDNTTPANTGWKCFNTPACP